MDFLSCSKPYNFACLECDHLPDPLAYLKFDTTLNSINVECPEVEV